jgi:hypothetical protein
MADPTTKSELLDLMHEGRARWEGVIAEVGDELMTLPGVEGDWSVKDIVAHVNYYEWALLRYLDGALHNEKPASNPQTAGMDMDQRNAWIHENNRARSIQDVLEESSKSYGKLLENVQALPENDLFDANRFDWTEGSPLWEAVPGDNYDHYADHEANIRAWLAKA